MSRPVVLIVFIITFCHVVTAGPHRSRDTGSADVMTITVPSTARLGHVVTVLDLPHGHRGKILRTSKASHKASSKPYHIGASPPEPYRVFTLQSHGRLTTRRSLEDLVGQTLVIQYQHTFPDGTEVVNRLNVLITNSDSAVQFTNQPYDGRVEENQSPGTPVEGLRNLFDDIKTLPYGCTINLIGHDAELVVLERSPLSVVTKVQLDREMRAALHMGVEARCPSGPLHATVTIHVRDVNDNYPQMAAPFYSKIIHTNQIQYEGALLRVHATDLDKADTVTYEMKGSRNFEIDPDTGDIFIRPRAQMMPKSFELTVYAIDAAHHRSEPSFVRVELAQAQTSRRHLRLHRRDVMDMDAVPMMNVAMVTRDTIIQVIRRVDDGDLFSVAADMDNTANERLNQ